MTIEKIELDSRIVIAQTIGSELNKKIVAFSALVLQIELDSATSLEAL